MRKQNKIINLFVIALIILNIICIGKVYADPNSSKGFAEYDDTKAEEENQKMLEEQQKEIKESEGKSSNNYLDKLEVEGYELTPKFDKQTIEYTLNGVAVGSQINIVATPDDAKATVQGAGKVKIEENQEQIRIDVIAQTGTVRTYTIYLSVQEKQEQQNIVQEPMELESIETNSSYIDNTNSSNSNNNQNSSIFMYIVIAIIVIMAVLGIITLIIKNKKNNGKHY